MNMKKLLVILGVVLLFASSTVDALASGSNGGFETDTIDTSVNPPLTGPFVTLPAGDGTISGWTINSGSIDYILSYWQPAEGQRSVDLNGLSAGSISETVPTTAGTMYKVSFALSGNPDSSADPSIASPSDKVVEVSAAGSSQNFHFDTATVGNTLTNMMWQTKSFTFTATDDSTTITFASQIPGAFGPALDNIVVTVALPTVQNDCKNGGWKSYGVFKNQGDCVSYVETGGKNLPAGQ